MSDRQPNAFDIEEYRALRSELALRLRDYEAWERCILTLIVASYLWLGVHGGAAHKAIWWIPVLISVLGVVRTIAYQQRLDTFYQYLHRCEGLFATTEQLPGWRHFIDSDGAGAQRIITRTVWIFWGMLNVVTIGVAFAMMR